MLILGMAGFLATLVFGVFRIGSAELQLGSSSWETIRTVRASSALSPIKKIDYEDKSFIIWISFMAKLEEDMR